MSFFGLQNHFSHNVCRFNAYYIYSRMSLLRPLEITTNSLLSPVSARPELCFLLILYLIYIESR